MSWFSFVLPGKRTRSHETKDFVSATAEQLGSVLGVKEGEVLFIRTPKFKQILPGAVVPLQEFPQLATSSKFVNFERPEFYLFARPVSETFILSIAVTVENSGPTAIPPFFVDFNTKEFENKGGADVEKKVLSEFGLPVNSASVYFKGKDVKQCGVAADMIYEAKETGFVMKVECTDEAMSQMKKRTYIVQEIITTEENYVNDLHLILDVWQARILKSGIMKAEASNIVFKDIPAIHVAQNAFLQDLKRTGSEYGAEVAKVFLEFAPAFKYSQHYVSNYPAIVDVLTHYERKQKWMKTVREIQEDVHGRDLHSYLITPVQRMPRYILFLRDLLKCTPSSHPDFELLKFAYDEILNVTQQFDKTTATAKTQAVLTRLQQSITNGFVFLDQRRELLMQCAVSYCDSKGSKGHIYLFSDLIILVLEGPKGAKVLFDSGVDVFRFKNQWPTMDSFSVETIGKPYCKRRRAVSKFSFDDAGEEDAFFMEISRIQDHAMLKSTARFAIQWDNIDMTTTIFPFVKPKAVCLDDAFYVFSGSNPIDVYVVKNDDMVHSQTLPSHIKQVSVCLVGRSVYIWSYENLYRYDPITKSLETVTLDCKIKQRKGASLVYTGSHLIMFGGKGGTAMGSEYYSNVYMIDITTNHVEELECEGEGPTARWNHAAAFVEGKMIVCGGSGTGGMKDDVFILDPVARTWTPVALSIGKRKRHSIVLLGTLFLVILGGVGESATRIIDYFGMQPVELDQFGNVDSCEYASSVVTSEAAYVIAGSRDKKTQFSSVYILNTPPTLRPVLDDKRDTRSSDRSSTEVGGERKKTSRKHIKSVSEKHHRRGKRSKQSPKRQYLSDMKSEIPKQEPVVTPEVTKKSLEKVRRLSLITTDESDEPNIYESSSSFHLAPPSPETTVPEPATTPEPPKSPVQEPPKSPVRETPKVVEIPTVTRCHSFPTPVERTDKYGLNDSPLLESYDVVETEQKSTRKRSRTCIILAIIIVLLLVGGAAAAGVLLTKK